MDSTNCPGLDVAERAWKTMEGHMGLRAMEEARVLAFLPDAEAEEAERLGPQDPHFHFVDVDDDDAVDETLPDLRHSDGALLFNLENGWDTSDWTELEVRMARLDLMTGDMVAADDRKGKSMLLAEYVRQQADKAVVMGQIYALAARVAEFDNKTDELYAAHLIEHHPGDCWKFCDRALDKAEIRIRAHSCGLLAPWELKEARAKVSEFVRTCPNKRIRIAGRRATLAEFPVRAQIDWAARQLGYAI